MTAVSLALVALGMAAIVIGAIRVRGPMATYRRLQDTEANLARYDAWRGAGHRVDDTGPTGADVMKERMRRAAMLWGGMIAVGVVLVLAGLLIR
jgi:hypothetical protein